MSLWMRGGKIIVDASGKLIECDYCPCVHSSESSESSGWVCSGHENPPEIVVTQWYSSFQEDTDCVWEYATTYDAVAIEEETTFGENSVTYHYALFEGGEVVGILIELIYNCTTSSYTASSNAMQTAFGPPELLDCFVGMGLTVELQ